MSTNKDDFYVGYLALPASHAKTLRVFLPVLLLGAAGVAVLVGAAQRDPGAAEWRQEPESVRGVLLADPCPLVLGEDGGVTLLVEEGKHGAHGRVAPLDGKIVVAKGRVLARDGRTVLELLPGDDALTVEGAGTIPSAGGAPETATLIGEIIDSKCYHGAMKPGEGKTHKACATLCIGNGVPAMFLDEEGRAYIFATGGTTPDADTLSKIGERVQVAGEVTALGNARVLRVAPGSVQRLSR
jgi:hypothetical protein